MDLRRCDENTGFGIKLSISELPQAPGRRQASAEKLKKFRPVNMTWSVFFQMFWNNSDTLAHRRLCRTAARGRAAGSCHRLEGSNGELTVSQVVELLPRVGCVARHVEARPENQHVKPAVAHLELEQLLHLVLV